jgi:hypothetical protein
MEVDRIKREWIGGEGLIAPPTLRSKRMKISTNEISSSDRRK